MTAFISTFLHAPWMLVGLALLAIPPLIHLLNRRRHDVVDWGAMQFLQVSQTVRRRLLLEEILLMLLRVGLLGVLVIALAGPFFDAPTSSRAASAAPRDTVLLLDGSASMAVTDAQGGATPLDRAVAWARGYLERRAGGDQVAVLLVRERVVPLVGALTPDLARGRAALASVPAPAGGCDWPDAVRQAHRILATSQKAHREIVILGDNQKASWADTETLFRWELLRGDLRLEDVPAIGRPILRMLDLSGDRPARVPNVALGPIIASRPVVPADREVVFRSALIVTGQATFEPPHRLRLEVDGKAVQNLPIPGKIDTLPATGKVPLRFTHRFARPGIHRVSLIVEPDIPVGARPAGYVVRDCVPGDNRQEFVVEVVDAIGVLIVDGSTGRSSAEHGAGFLRDALSPLRDPRPAVRARVISASEFADSALQAQSRPRVVILHDVASLSEPAVLGLTNFLAAGGGLLVTLGDRAEAGWYNSTLFRDGTGWLPARVEGVSAEEARPDRRAFSHPILELFARDSAGGFAEARFPKWRKLSIPDRHSLSMPIGQLLSASGTHPLMVERRHGLGHVVVSAVPLDASWGTNLVDLQAFVPLVYETVYFLAGARSAEHNLRPGQLFRMRVPADARLDAYRLTPPGLPELPLSAGMGQADAYPAEIVVSADGPMLVVAGTQTPGVYRLQRPKGEAIPFVVGSDPREADLEPCSAEDRDRVHRLIGGTDLDPDTAEPGVESDGGAMERRELWWYLLVGLLGLLVLEVYLTRRLVMSR